ncbi:MAG: pinensin family lanthipeptide [Bacteroidota bacterium]
MKKKISLDKLKVDSFVTSNQLENTETVKGGLIALKTDPPACRVYSEGPECTKPTFEAICSRFATACGSCPPYCQVD